MTYTDAEIKDRADDLFETSKQMAEALKMTDVEPEREAAITAGAVYGLKTSAMLDQMLDEVAYWKRWVIVISALAILNIALEWFEWLFL